MSSPKWVIAIFHVKLRQLSFCAISIWPPTLLGTSLVTGQVQVDPPQMEILGQSHEVPMHHPGFCKLSIGSCLRQGVLLPWRGLVSPLTPGLPQKEKPQYFLAERQATMTHLDPTHEVS